jgi:hypothetical protein
MHVAGVETDGAYVLRENTGTSGLEQTVRSAVGVLADHDIPHLIAGGLAVQEHGYFRVTLDADIIVPDVLEAVEWLTADLSGPFKSVPGAEDTVCDTRNGAQINFLPAGRVLRSRCKVPFPEPNVVSERPRFVTLEKLVSLKLDSWSASPTSRLRDKSDVVELIKSRKLPRDLAVDDAVRSLYVETWDALSREG